MITTQGRAGYRAEDRGQPSAQDSHEKGRKKKTRALRPSDTGHSTEHRWHDAPQRTLDTGQDRTEGNMGHRTQDRGQERTQDSGGKDE